MKPLSLIKCPSAVVGSYAMVLVQFAPPDTCTLVRAFVDSLVDVDNAAALEDARALLLLDGTARRVLPLACRALGDNAAAIVLEGLTPIVDENTWQIAHGEVDSLLDSSVTYIGDLARSRSLVAHLLRLFEDLGPGVAGLLVAWTAPHDDKVWSIALDLAKKCADYGERRERLSAKVSEVFA